MGSFGSFYKGDKRKAKKAILERKAEQLSRKQTFILPKVEIVKKGKNEE